MLVLTSQWSPMADLNHSGRSPADALLPEEARGGWTGRCALVPTCRLLLSQGVITQQGVILGFDPLESLWIF